MLMSLRSNESLKVQDVGDDGDGTKGNDLSSERYLPQRETKDDKDLFKWRKRQKNNEEGDRETGIPFCYKYDNYQQRRRLEAEYSIDPKYLERHLASGAIKSNTAVNWRMRTILLDWLVEVNASERLFPETLFLGANIIDRFLQEKPLSRRQLQLVGSACMWIASKYCDVRPIGTDTFYELSDGYCKCKDIVRVETTVLNTLRWKIAAPTTYDFLMHLLDLTTMKMTSPVKDKFKSKGKKKEEKKEDDEDEDITSTLYDFANYVAELALLDKVLLIYTPSQQALASLYVAMAHVVLLKVEPMTKGRRKITTNVRMKFVDVCMRLPPFARPLTDDEMKTVYDCSKRMLVLLKDATISSLVAVYEKYSSRKRKRVAEIEPLDRLPPMA
jgi:hypothetical protein